MRNIIDHDSRICCIDAYGNLLPQGKKKQAFKLKKSAKLMRDCGKVDIGFRGMWIGIDTSVDRIRKGNFAP